MSNVLKPSVHFKGHYTPEYATPASAGLDLRSTQDGSISPGSWLVVGTGLFLEIPTGFMGQVCPRSGLAAKHGVTVLNAPGIIDSDYRGEVKVILSNQGSTEFSFKKGDRIAQLIFVPVMQVNLTNSEQLSSTLRGDGGFGSTGIT